MRLFKIFKKKNKTSLKCDNCEVNSTISKTFN